MRPFITTERADRSSNELTSKAVNKRTIDPLDRLPASVDQQENPFEQTASKNRRRSCLDQFDRDAELKRTLRTLQMENSQLKSLVVRLSETIVKSVVGRLQGADTGEKKG